LYFIYFPPRARNFALSNRAGVNLLNQLFSIDYGDNVITTPAERQSHKVTAPSKHQICWGVFSKSVLEPVLALMNLSRWSHEVATWQIGRNSRDSGMADGRIASDIAFFSWKPRTLIGRRGGMISFAQKKTGSIAIMRFDKDTAAVLRPLPAFGLLFPHLCSFSPCLDDSELFCFLKYRRPFCPVNVSCDY